jgi:hypothetical protein
MTAHARDTSCQERIDAALADRLAELRDLSESEDDGQWEEHQPLSVETKNVTIILLSWGGPSDWYEVTQDERGAIERISYHYANWFDHAERPLTGQELELAEAVLSRYLDA